jgi:hypothetical protein
MNNTLNRLISIFRIKSNLLTKTDSSALLGCGGCIAGLEIGDIGEYTLLATMDQITIKTPNP